MIDKSTKQHYEMQGKVKNYLGKQKMVKAPLYWRSGAKHPKTELAYITKKEKDLLIKKDLHKSLKGGVNRGPAGIMSLNGWGSRDERQNVSGAAASAAESGRNTSDTLAAGMSNQDVQDFRSAAIASGAGQNVNPGWFGPRHRVSRDELRAAKAFAPGAYRATRGNPMGNVLRGALGFFGGVPGKLMSGIMTAADYAKRKGTGAWEGIQEFGEYDTLQDYFNRNKTGALQPVETIDIREKFDRTGNNNLAVDNQVIEDQNVNPNFLALGAKDGGRIGFNKGGNYAQNEVAGQLFGTSFNVLDPFQQGQVNDAISAYGTTSIGTLKAQGGRIGAQEGGLMDLGGMEKDYRNDGGFVPLGEEEKADDVPARLSKNEFVFTADAVRGAGGGDIDKGAEIMENVMENLENGGNISEESQGREGAKNMFATAQRLEGVI